MNFRNHLLIFSTACLVLLGGCDRGESRHAEFFVFGTVMEITLWGTSDEQAEHAFAELQRQFQAMHRDWHAWEPGLLTDINQAFAAGAPARADSDIVEMVRRSQDIENKTGGLFNPAIGALIRLWGFHTSDYPVVGPPPDAAEIAGLVQQRPSSQDIRIDGLLLSSSNPAVQLDFGGLAKGYAIDLACALLRQLRIDNAIVNAGGDLRTIGSHGDRPWRIAIRNPTGGIIGGIETHLDEAIFTSGVYERFRQDEQRRFPHILDPRSGWPVDQLLSVTVIADEGLLADAAATALIVGGLDEWAEVARSLDITEVLLVGEDGTVYLTPEMNTRVEFVEDVKRLIVGLDAD